MSDTDKPADDAKPATADDKKKPHPGWHALAIFFQYVLGPALTAAITAWGMYVTQIRPKVEKDASRAVDAREMIREHLLPRPTMPTPTGVGPVVPPQIDAQPAVATQDDSQLQQLPPELRDRWIKAGLDDDFGPLEREWQRQSQDQVQEQQ